MTQTKKEPFSGQDKKKKVFSLKIFNSFLFLLIIAGSLYYLIGINNLIVKGFRLQELKKEVNLSKNENKNFELKTMFLESYNNLSERAEDLSMVVASEIGYITITDGVVVKK